MKSVSGLSEQILTSAFPSANVKVTQSVDDLCIIASKLSPDIILVDTSVEADSLCAKLKLCAHTLFAPIILISSNSNSVEAKINAWNAGALFTLASPINELELQASITSLIKSKIACLKAEALKTGMDLILEEKTKDLRNNHIATLNLLEDLKSENDARKASEEALRLSEEKFRTLMDNSPEGISIYVDEKLVYLNKKAAALMKAEDESSLIGYSIIDFIHPDNKDCVLQRMKHVSLAPLNIALPSVEEQYLCLDGSIIDVEIIVMPIIYEGKRAIQLSGHDITEKKLSAQKLLESEEKFRFFFKNSPQPMFIYDIDTFMFLDVNLSAQELYGYTAEEFQNLSVSDLRPADQLDTFNNHLASINDDSITHIEWEDIKKNGEKIIVEVIATTHKAGGRSERHVMIKDITSKKKAELELLESEEKFRLIFSENPQPMFIYDLDSLDFLEVNQSAVDLYGYSREEFKQMNLFRIRPDEDVLPFFSHIQAVKVNPYIENPVWRHIKKDGTQIYVEVTATTLTVNNRRERHALINDISQRIKAEEQLRLSEEKYRTILENSNDLIWMLDLDERITYMNKQSMETFAMESHMAKGKKLKEICDVDDVDDEKLRTKVFEAVLRGEKCRSSFVLTAKNSKEVCLSVSSLPIYSEGLIVGVINFGQDVTKERKIADELEENRLELKAIYDNAPVMMCVLDDNASIMFTNKAFEKITSFTEKNPIGEQFGNIISCIGASTSPRGCGHGFKCKNCALRDALVNTLHTGKGHSFVEHSTSIVLKGEYKDLSLLASTALIQSGNARKVLLCLHDITEMKIAEKKLKDSADSYFGLFDTVQQAIFIQRPDMSFIDVNHGAVEMFGYPKGHFIGSFVEHYLAPEMNDIEELHANIAQAFRGIPCHYELWGLAKDGHSFPMEVWTLKGKYFGEEVLITLANNISERKVTEKVILENEARLNAMFQFSPVAIWEEDFSNVLSFTNEILAKGVMDLNAYFLQNPSELKKAISLIKVQAINTKNLEIFGANSTQEVLENLNHYFYYNVETLNVFRNEIVSLVNGNNNFECETQIVNLKGELRYLYLNLIVIPGFENSLSKVLVSFTDMTTRRKAEEALQKSERFLRTFVENSPFEIWARDVNCVGILENKKSVDRFGSILGRKPNQTKLANTDALRVWEVNNFRAFSGELVDEETVYTIQGQRATYQQIVFPIVNNDTIIGIAGFNIDITERKKAEDALRKSEEKLKNFSAHLQTIREEEKIALAREIHDDLGQILVALKIDMGMFRQLLLKNIETVQNSIVNDSIDSMMQLIDNTIKTTRRIMNGLRPEQLEVLGFIDAVKLYIKEFEERHHIECGFSTNVDKLDIDAQKSLAMFRILQEAMTNVSRHSRASTVQITVESSVQTIYFEIADNGVGMELNRKVQINSYGMIGMNERIELLGGELEVISSPGNGTSIRVFVDNTKI